MKRMIWSGALITALLLIFARRIRGSISARLSSVARCWKNLVAYLDPVRRVIARGIAILIGFIARLLMKHRSGRFPASRLLVGQGLPIPRVARRTKVAQDAVRMLIPGTPALPRRRHTGNFFRSAEPAAGRGS